MKYFLLTNKGSSISNLSYLKTIILFMVMAQWSYRSTVTDSLFIQLEILNGKNRIPVLNQLADEFKRHPTSTKDYEVEVVEPEPDQVDEVLFLATVVPRGPDDAALEDVGQRHRLREIQAGPLPDRGPLAQVAPGLEAGGRPVLFPRAVHGDHRVEPHGDHGELGRQVK